jgi:hypothetical protein
MSVAVAGVTDPGALCVANSGTADVGPSTTTQQGEIGRFPGTSFHDSGEEDPAVCQAIADRYFRKNRKLAIAVTRTGLLDSSYREEKRKNSRGR